jgi:aryl-alcohol dehydrogenase-like predicted oxidoreductase
MKYKIFGKTGLRVSEIALGGMTIGEDWGWGADKETSKKVFDYFVNKGGNFIDTAINYTNGTSEKYVGDFISSDRDYFVLATKYSLSTKEGDPNRSGNHRKNMMYSVDASLKRMNTDYIDLYWVHAWDKMTPEEEILRGLDDLVRTGKILYIGISDTPAWIVSRCNTIAELKGWTAFAGIQVQYNLILRDIERELLPMTNKLDLAITAWGTLAAGFLTGKYNKSANEKNTAGARLTLNPTSSLRGIDRLRTENNIAIAEEVEKISIEIGKTPTQVAVNWARQKSYNIIPIIGARNVAQLEDSLGCIEFKLSDAQMERLDKISEIKLGFPHDMISAQMVRDYVTSKMDDKIEKHRPLI